MKINIIRAYPTRHPKNSSNILTLLAREIKDIRLLQSAMLRLQLGLDVYPDIPSDKMARDILTEKCYK